jgi:hypothetical protein
MDMPLVIFGKKGDNMTVKKEVVNLRKKYIIYNINFWRIQFSLFKMGKKCDLRIQIHLGEQW